MFAVIFAGPPHRVAWYATAVAPLCAQSAKHSNTQNISSFILGRSQPPERRTLRVTLRKLYFHFLSRCMGYDCGDSFPFDFEANGIPFGSKSKGELSPRSYPI